MDLGEKSFLAHHTEGDIVDVFVRDMLGDNPDGYVGACVLLPRWLAPTQADWIASLEPSVDYVIGDPDTRRLHLPFDGRGRARHELAYLSESDPLANRGRFVTNTLRAQLVAGRDILISPWLIHGISGDDRELRASVDFAQRSANHSLAENAEVVLMGLEATQEIFADDNLRNRMIDEVVEGAAELPIYLRMTIDAPESRRPYSNEEALVGLRAAIEAFRANGREVVLPQSGLCGWLMLAFGASAFGAGTTSSMERNVRPAVTGGGGGNPPLHWYLSPDLLSPVLAEELPELHRSGVPACQCRYCVADPPTPGAGFNRRSADLHYLWCCASLAEEVRQASDQVMAVRSRVESAQDLWRQVRAARVPLDPRSRENHLAAWSAAIA